MKINAEVVSLVQGTPEWHQHRARHYNASELASAMGISPHATRAALVAQKASGIAPEVDEHQQRRFDKGHQYEAQAREWAEEIVGEDLYPTTLRADVEGMPLSASLDGQTMLGDVIWEHKTINAGIGTALDAGEIPEQYHPQMEQGLLLSGAERCLFMASAGDRETMRYAWYESRPEIREKIIPSWAQFAEDVANYEHREDPVEAVGRAPDQLPALRIEVSGQVRASNLDAFRDHALAVFAGINTDLQTDSDFADAEKTTKWCKEVESKLEAAKDQALAQTASIDELFRAIDSIKEEARAKRLELEKLVKARKDAIRREIVADGKSALAQHVESLSKSTGMAVPAPAADFAAAIKGKRTISSLRDAADTLLAQAKIEANEAAELIRGNLRIIERAGHPQLFHDRARLVLFDPEHVEATVKLRVAEHEQAEQKRLAAERERIRAEEEAKARRQAEQECAAESDAQDAQALREREAKPAPAACQPNPVPQARRAPPEVITIERAEYESLLADRELLTALRAAGVDSWDGYEHAISLWEAA